MERPSPSAAAVDAFTRDLRHRAGARNPVARAAARRGFAPVPLAVLREEMPGAAFPDDAAAWRGPGEAGNAVLLWDGATATCELRAQRHRPARGRGGVRQAAAGLRGHRRLRDAPAAPPPARAGVPRTRQMLLVSSGGPERARVLRLGDDEATAPDAVTLSARGVAGAGPAVVLR
jgi:hypothetical protein